MKKALLIISVGSMLILPLVVMAQPQMNWGLGQFESQTQLTNNDLTVVIGRIVQIVLGFLGLAAVVAIIVGGVMTMTSAGDEDKIKKGNTIIKDGAIGLLIVVLAYAISLFVINIITRVVQQ